MNPELIVEMPSRLWPEQVTLDWRRFSSGLWRVPEGDISEAYSASTMPKVQVFRHDGTLFTNGGACHSKAVMTTVDAYPLILPADYHGPDTVPYSYEGYAVCYQSKAFRLGPKVRFTSSDPTVAEWRYLFRVLYADGGYFASQANYGLFLDQEYRGERTANGEIAHGLELADGLLSYTKEDMRCFLDGKSKPASKLQLDLTF